MSFQGKEVLFLRGTQHSHLPRPRRLRLPKPVWVLIQGSSIPGPDTRLSTPLPQDDTGRKERGGPKAHQAGESPRTSTAEAAGSARLGAHHSLTAGPYQGGAGHPPRPRGLPGSVPHPREVSTSGSSANIPHPPVWAPAQGPQGLLNRLYLPFFLC